MGKPKGRAEPKPVVVLPEDVRELIIGVLKDRDAAAMHVSVASAEFLRQQVGNTAIWDVQAKRVLVHTNGRYALRPDAISELFDDGRVRYAVFRFSVLPSAACKDEPPAQRLVAVMADGSVHTEYRGRRGDLHVVVR